MEADLKTYFERIEEFFCRQRGAPLLLSPLDFEKVVEWYAAGISAEVVEEGIADYFHGLASRKVPLKRAICLSFAEDRVLKAREARRAAAVGRDAGLPEAEPQEARVERFLASRSALLRAFSSDPASSASRPVLARFALQAAEALDALAAQSGTALSRIEAVLAPLDQQLCSLVLLEAPPEEAAELREAALRRLGDLAQTMDAQSLNQTLDRLAKQGALDRCRLPRLSLLYLDG
jgi:hypothetical protein